METCLGYIILSKKGGGGIDGEKRKKQPAKELLGSSHEMYSFHFISTVFWTQS